METTAYFDSVCAARAFKISDEDSLAGGTLISAESCPELTAEQGIYNYITDNFASFVKYVQLLPSKDREMLMSYYLISKPQTIIGKIAGLTQTTTSSQIRLAIRALCALIMWQGKPTQQQLESVLTRAGREQVIIKNLKEQKLPFSLSQMLTEYDECHSFAAVAHKHGLHRPTVRASFKSVAEEFDQSPDPTLAGLSAYIQILINKASAKGAGYTAKTQAKFKEMTSVAHDVCGQFTVDIEDPNFSELFTSRANN